MHMNHKLPQQGNISISSTMSFTSLFGRGGVGAPVGLCEGVLDGRGGEHRDRQRRWPPWWPFLWPLLCPFLCLIMCFFVWSQGLDAVPVEGRHVQHVTGAHSHLPDMHRTTGKKGVPL